MLDSFSLENKLKNNEISNCYIFCGSDEQSIKGVINKILDSTVKNNFLDLNYTQLDGLNVDADTILNACETLPFMCDKKVVIVYRAAFLKDKCDKDREKVYKYIEQYIPKVPKECILIMYYIFENDREKESSKLKKLDKKCQVVKFAKLKGVAFQKKVKEIFDEKSLKIQKPQLALFCASVENNMDVIENEIEKLYCYTYGREVTTQDIHDIVTLKSDNDIFNLVDYISKRKPEKALDILNELMFKGENANVILRMIERQFNLLLNIKLGMESGKNKDILSRELKLHPFICENMMKQSQKFNFNQIKKSIDICLETEKNLKSISTDTKMEMELLIINTARS